VSDEYPYYSPSSIRNFFKRSEVSIRKKWGQNFLIDPNLSVKIANSLLLECRGNILEIGPGLGVLTAQYLKQQAEVHAVEIDPALVQELETRFSQYKNFHLYNQDAQKFLLKLQEDDDFRRDLKIQCAGGNLPYYITSGLLTRLVLIPGILKGVFLVQKEYALRCSASSSESSLNVFLNNFGSWKILFNAPPSVFYPAPEVQSSIIEFSAYEKRICDAEILQKILRMSFRGKRKKIKNAWAMSDAHYSLDIMTEASAAAGISLEKRPEEIHREEYYNLVEFLQKILLKQ